MKDFASAHIIVNGIVQGVGFRWFVVRTAESLGVTGWTRNRYDGSVEIEAEGTKSSLEALLKEVRIGPRMASVSDIAVEWRPYEARHKSFDVRF